jgi:type I restriction enzyme S subunit
MRLNIGSIARNRSGADCLVSPDYVVFTTDPSVLLPAYLDQVRRSDIWSDFVRPAGAGSVRVRIYFRDLAEIQIPLPSLDEQRRIVHVLEAADREIASLEKLRDAYDAQKRAVMQRLLSGDLLLPAPTAAPELAHA